MNFSRFLACSLFVSLLTMGSSCKKHLAPSGNSEPSIPEISKAPAPQELTKEGLRYLRGENGVEKDFGRGIQLLESAANLNNSEAQSELCTLFWREEYVPNDKEKAVQWWLNCLAKEPDNPVVSMILAEAYATGEGIQKDEAKALEMYIELSGAFPSYGYSIGLYYAQGVIVEKNIPEAISWYQKAAEYGVVPAQLELANRYNFGNEVTIDKVEAAKWYEMAANNGSVEGMYRIGRAYSEGIGVPKDAEVGLKWFLKAATEGLVEAQCVMASHYMEGEHTEKNVVAGADWSRKAAEQNHPPGQVQLGWCFEQGCGVPKDYESAYMWFNLAAVSEMAGAAKFRDDLAKNMTSEEIAQAQKRSREWLINFNAR